MTTLFYRFPILFLTILLLPASLFAQDGGGAIVTGQITDADRRPLRGAVVSVSGTNQRTLSNEAGFYRLANVPAGEHRIEVSYIGYDSGAATVTAVAGEATRVDVVMEMVPVMVQGIIVEGEAFGSRAAALNRQATAASVLNVISAEQIERFPDPQVADALRRVPGVATFDDRGEAENVFLRGPAPGLTVVTLDGERLPTTGLRNREVSLSAMPAEMLSSIEVVKAITPDMDADAPAGTINLVTRQPLGDRTYFNASAAGGLHENGYGTNALAGLHFGQNRGDLSYMLR
jgi:hypothetical protein